MRAFPQVKVRKWYLIYRTGPALLVCRDIPVQVANINVHMWLDCCRAYTAGVQDIPDVDVFIRHTVCGFRALHIDTRVLYHKHDSAKAEEIHGARAALVM
jgi:hypothetical protein